MGSIDPTRPVRIMNISGSPCDKRDAIANAAAMDEKIDVLVGDWMSELNMPTRAYDASKHVGIGYEESFLEALEPALENISKKGIKLAANAGAVATKELYEAVVKMVEEKNLPLTIAWIEGDSVLDKISNDLKANPSSYYHISTGQSFKDWGYEPVFGQCYLGGMGIASAFEAGADIVICGRVADASPIIGAAAWWHGWSRTHYDELAQSLMAGHLIECSVYVTGGNFTGFKSLEWSGINNLGYPIAEISSNGGVVITKPEGTGGIVSVETCKEQLLYEIQGIDYLNCDVTAVIDQATFSQIGANRVQLSGVTGKPPPATTKCGLTAFGGYQAEIHWAMVGLDIAEKCQLLESQLRHSFGKARLAKLSLWNMSVYGTAPENPRNQNACTVDVRLIAQSKNIEDLSESNFMRPALDMNMHTYPAATFHTDLRTAVPKSVSRVFVNL
jgi:Acyclic terpene utilisation family protein AtuA